MIKLWIVVGGYWYMWYSRDYVFMHHLLIQSDRYWSYKWYMVRELSSGEQQYQLELLSSNHQSKKGNFKIMKSRTRMLRGYCHHRPDRSIKRLSNSIPCILVSRAIPTWYLRPFWSVSFVDVQRMVAQLDLQKAIEFRQGKRSSPPMNCQVIA